MKPSILRPRSFDRVIPSFIGGTAYYKKVARIQSNNLIGFWRQNEAPAGNNYLTFNGTNTQINCGSGATLDDLHDAEFTVDFWMQLKTTPGTFDVLFTKGDQLGEGWVLYLNSSGQLVSRVRCVTTTATSTSAASYITADSTWHHLVMYFNDAGDRKIYYALDGVWAASYATQTAGVDAIVSDATRSLRVGVYDDASLPFDGYMGWIRISNNDRFNHTTDFTAPSRTTIPTVDANTVSLWPMDEGYGSVAGDIGTNNNDGTISNGDWGAYPTAVDSSAQANDGAYTGVNLANAAGPDGVLVPLWDGVNDFNNVYSAALNSDFSGAAGTMLAWTKVYNAGVWSDSTVRYMMQLYVDANNYVYLTRTTTNGQLLHRYRAGATSSSVFVSSQSDTGWVCWVITWDAVADEVKVYKNGSQSGSTQTGLGTWAGSLNPVNCLIGAANTSAGGPWYGWFGPCAVWTVALTAGEVLQASTV